jgi:hypothetical protein
MQCPGMATDSVVTLGHNRTLLRTSQRVRKNCKTEKTAASTVKAEPCTEKATASTVTAAACTVKAEPKDRNATFFAKITAALQRKKQQLGQAQQHRVQVQQHSGSSSSTRPQHQ